MKIAIIGSGNVGKALASAASKAGHDVTIGSRDREKAKQAAQSTNAEAADTPKDAVKASDLVVLAVPANKVDEVVMSLADDLDGKVVIDVTNRIDMQNPAKNLDGTSMAEHIQQSVPKAHVVKAFNYSFASRMTNPKMDGTRLDGFVAGDDEEAKKKTLEFVRSVGFRPIDAGPLPMARALEAMGALLVHLQVKHRWPWQNGWKLTGPPEDTETA
ncbi:MAG TPA: NADPH-dependent F420 reductase [Candidatus Dormibacteraeota bacterium]|nr:NADPH-dependent F420 reductase [Candidatus Dormibacteraeota bacterium]